jgi:hypothetical protein
MWRHVLVKVGNSYFDVDGKVLLNDAIANYCWGQVIRGLGGPADGGVAVNINHSELIKELRSMLHSSFDGARLAAWKKTLVSKVQ